MTSYDELKTEIAIIKQTLQLLLIALSRDTALQSNAEYSTLLKQTDHLFEALEAKLADEHSQDRLKGLRPWL